MGKIKQILFENKKKKEAKISRISRRRQTLRRTDWRQRKKDIEKEPPTVARGASKREMTDRIGSLVSLRVSRVRRSSDV